MTTTFPADDDIGREHALTELKSLADEAAARHEVAVIRIAGAAGIGKTTFLRRVLTLFEDVAIASASASPADKSAPGACARRLGESVQVTPGPDGVEAALNRAAILCIDDAQWLDELSLRMIGGAISARTHGIVLFADRRESAPELIKHHTIHLEPVSDDAAGRIVRRCDPTAPQHVVDAIIKVSGGSPFTLSVLAGEASHGTSRTPQRGSPSVRYAIRRRLDRAEPPARELVRLCAAVEGAADLRPVARACGVTLEAADAIVSDFSDMLEMQGTTVSFRHALIREAVADTIGEPIRYYRRLLTAYDGEAHAKDRSAVILRCALACGEDETAAAYAFAIGRQAAAAGASATAVQFLETAIEHAGRPLTATYAVNYATALSHAGRDVDAAEFLRRELRNAVDARDADRAAELAVSLAPILLTLERQPEFNAACDRIAAMREADDRTRRRLRTARLATLAFGGRFGEYHRVAGDGPATAGDNRSEAFVASLRGDDALARHAMQTYQAQLESADGRQEPADKALESLIALHAIGNAGLARVEETADGGDATYQGISHLRIAARIHDGRWEDVRQILQRVPLWDRTYEEPTPILDVRLELDALAGRVPAELRRTRRSIASMIARQQHRHAVTPARWYVIALQRAGEPGDAQIDGFVAESLDMAPVPYSLGGIPLAVALLQMRFGAGRCLAALDRWPRYGSRWASAHLALARALLTDNRAQLRHARAEFEVMGAPVFAMIAGLALPAPRARDVELARSIGYLQVTERARPALTSRESDIAELVAQDLTNRSIAERLGISERTVEVHLTNLYRKLGVRSRSGLARLVDTGVDRPTS